MVCLDDSARRQRALLASVVGLFLIGFSSVESGVVLMGYMADSYRSYAVGEAA